MSAKPIDITAGATLPAFSISSEVKFIEGTRKNHSEEDNDAAETSETETAN